MQKQKVMLATLLSLIIPISCASLTIETWIIQQGELVHGVSRMTALQAQGYRCYSEADDTAWREQLKLESDCCGGR